MEPVFLYSSDFVSTSFRLKPKRLRWVESTISSVPTPKLHFGDYMYKSGFFVYYRDVRVDIPQDLQRINTIFRSAGFELYLVGGAVRNIVLGYHPADWDLASNAQPQDVIALFKHVIPTGIQHGTVTLRFKKKSYEITTFRIDGSYSDIRHPDSVEYTADIYEDLCRRDFTINAMAYNLQTHRLLDPHDGQEDLRRRSIKTVGEPIKRFSEDGLRIIRGIRFASTLGFNIEQNSYAAMKECQRYLRSVSIERIRDEFNKILSSPRPSLGIGLLADSEILPHFAPTLNACRNGQPDEANVFQQLLASCDYAPQQNLAVRFAALTHSLGSGIGISSTKDVAAATASASSAVASLASSAASSVQESAEMARALCQRLKYPKVFEKRIYRLVQGCRLRLYPDMPAVQLRRFASKVGSDLISDLIELKRAIIAGKSGPFFAFAQQGEHRPPPAISLPDNQPEVLGQALTPPPIPWLDDLAEQLRTMLRKKTALDIGSLAINGHDLHTLAGIPRNRKMKMILDRLLELVLDDPNLNQKDTLIQAAQKLYAQEQKAPASTTPPKLG